MRRRLILVLRGDSRGPSNAYVTSHLDTDPYAHSNKYTCTDHHPYTHTDRHADSNSDADSIPHSHTHSCPNSNPNPHANAHPYHHTYPDAYSNASTNVRCNATRAIAHSQPEA